MFTGVHGSHIFLRLSEADRRQSASDYDEAAPFEPVKGHVMKEYMVVPDSLYEDEKAFKPWLKRAYEFAVGLPAKGPKPSKGKK